MQAIILAAGMGTRLGPKTKEIAKIFVDETENVVITGRKLRLIRRALRDKRFRGSDINRTLSFWDGVIKAEDKFLYGFIKYANFHIHTMHAFEPALYRNEFIEMTKEVSEDHPFYDYLKQICKGLEEFTTISSEFIPQNSLIREFIGQD